MGLGKAGVERNRLLELIDGLHDPLGADAVHVLACPDEELVRLHVVARAGADMGQHCGRQPRLERLRDLPGHVTLDREDVVQVPVVRLCPQVPVRMGLDELRRDSHAPSGLTHRSLQHGPHPEFPGDLAQGSRRLLVRHDRRAGDDVEIGDLGEVLEDVLGHPVAADEPTVGKGRVPPSGFAPSRPAPATAARLTPSGVSS